MRKSAGLSVGFLFDDTLDSTDGVAQHVKTLGAWLNSAGHEVSYLVGETQITSWAGGKVYSLARNVGVTFNGNRLSMPIASRKSALRKILADNHFDVLHVMVPYSPFMSQRVINLAPKSTAIVGTFHIFPAGRLSRGGTRLLRTVYASSLKRFGAMISVSPPAAQFCQQALGVASFIIPNPIVMPADIKQSASPEDSKNVVFLGRLVKRKGCAQLLRAFAELSVELPEARLTVAGSGPQEAVLKKLSGELKIADKTEFLGRIDESDKTKLLSSAGVACFPSLYGESFGLVLVEAMAAGAKTVLGGDNAGYRSVLGGQPDCLVNPLDTHSFARRLKMLLTDKSLQRRIYTWQKQAAKQYDIKVVGPQVEAVYRTAIARLDKNGHNNSYE